MGKGRKRKLMESQVFLSSLSKKSKKESIVYRILEREGRDRDRERKEGQ